MKNIQRYHAVSVDNLQKRVERVTRSRSRLWHKLQRSHIVSERIDRLSVSDSEHKRFVYCRLIRAL